MRTPPSSIDQTELAWAAGFFDGEGCTTTTGRFNVYPRITIAQVERENLERFHTAVGGSGYISNAITRYGNRRKPIYHYEASSLWAVREILALLWPWLGQAKKRQALHILERLESMGLGKRRMGKEGYCGRGHPFAGDNLYVWNGERYCRTCRREYGRRADAKRRPKH